MKRKVLSFLLCSQVALMLAQSFPVDSQLTQGVLPNGLTYYIKHNAKPEKKAELRLLVKAGSVLETDAQKGLAHFLEHMNFNGSKHFKKNDLVNYLQSIGVKFGADLNAYTSFNETVYMLPIPLDKENKNLDNGLQILADWANGALLIDKDIDAERGIVLEELRTAKGADFRMFMKAFPRLWAYSKYVDRIPIGTEEGLKTFKSQELRKFYHDWYRPDLMAVVVVGDVKSSEIKQKIEKYFKDIPATANAISLPHIPVNAYDSLSAMVVTDKEAQSIDVNFKLSARKIKPIKTVADYREFIKRSIFLDLLNKRFADLTQKANPPFVRANVSIEALKDYECLNFELTPRDSMAESINVLTTELLKAVQFGFDSLEYVLGKKNKLAYYESLYNERNTIGSDFFVSQYINNFLNDLPHVLMSIEEQKKCFDSLIATIDVKEVNASINTYFKLADVEHAFILASGPESEENKKVLSEPQLLVAFKEGFKQQVVANSASKDIDTVLLAVQPIPGKIIAQTYDKELDVYTYTLSNGIKVATKKTNFTTDEIVLSALKKGGGSNYVTTDKHNVYFLSHVIGSMGYGTFTPTALRDGISGKNIGASVSLGHITSDIHGNSSVKDLNTMFELMYLKFTQPRKDNELYTAFAQKLRSELEFSTRSPVSAFRIYLYSKIFNNDPLMPIVVPTPGDLDKINMDRIVEIYKKELSNSADGFNFFIVGDIDTNTLKPLIEKYIASLPITNTTPKITDDGLRIITGKHTFNFYAGKEDKSLIVGLYHKEIPYNEVLDKNLYILKEILNIKVTEIIREKMGAIYGGGFTVSFDEFPYSGIKVIAQFSCSPKNVAKIIKAVDEIISDIKKNKPQAKDLQKVKINLLEKHKIDLRENGYWMNQMQGLLFWNRDRQMFLNYKEVINKTTLTDIQDAAQLIFDDKNLAIGVFYPESMKP